MFQMRLARTLPKSESDRTVGISALKPAWYTMAPRRRGRAPQKRADREGIARRRVLAGLK